MSRESYDDVPYPAAPYGETHPSNLQTIATALGLTPPPIERCRVLELGCATGGNIVPMACAWPDATFVGIDYSSKQVEAAQRFASAVGASNLSLRTMSIADITPDFGTFDYIISHGIYSWVPPDVRAKVLEVSRANLSEHGVAYVSFNALPGWYSRLWLRDLVRRHVAPIADERPEERVKRVRELVEVVCEAPMIRNTPAEASLRRALAGYDSSDAGFTMHDLLEDENHPAYLTDVVAAAESQGLRYLADAQSNSSVVEEASSPAVGKLLASAGDDFVRREQTLDFLRNQTFRRALFVRSDRSVDRAHVHERIGAMFATTLLAADAPQEKLATPEPVNFRDVAGNVRVTFGTPLTKVAIQLLRMSFPRPMRVNDALDAAAGHLRMASNDQADRSVTLRELSEAWASRLIELHVTPPPMAFDLPERPEVWRLARHQLASGAQDVTNLRHETVKMDESVRDVLPLLDGTRTLEEFAEAAASSRGFNRSGAASLVANLIAFALLRA